MGSRERETENRFLEEAPADSNVLVLTAFRWHLWYYSLSLNK